eukprot:COSAG02_NODE_1734_length_11163_cov_43.814262_10_plen_1591_part_01
MFTFRAACVGRGGSSAAGELGALSAPRGEDMESHAEALFAAVDRDGSGLISYEEFASWWLRRANATSGSLGGSAMDEVKAKWDEMDRDGSGDLDASEFEALLTSLATGDWKEAYDAQRGKSYYYNKVTKETRWEQADGDTAVSDFLRQNGVSVQPRAKSGGMAAIASAKQRASRLANSDAARKARARASEQSARARALAREKAEQVQANEKFQKASAGATEFYASAEVWKAEAKTRHRDKLVMAGVSFAAAMLLGMIFMYEWMTYVPPVPVPPPPPRDTSTGGVGETGQIEALTHEWVWVYLNERYAHPVVLAGVVSTHEQHTNMDGETGDARDPAAPRVQAVQQGCPGWRGWCFQIRMQEPHCMEDGGVHLPGETMAWMVVERGVYHLRGQDVQDKLMQAGIISASGTAFVTVVPAPFDDDVDPVILTQVQTFKDPAFVKTRQRWATGYSAGAFEVKLEQALGDSSHGQEEIGWFAVEVSAGTLGTRLFEASFTARVNHAASTISFQSNFSDVPLVFASIGTFSGPESATVRSENRGRDSVRLLIHEDACIDHSTAHNTETVALLVIQSDSGDNAIRAEKLAEPSTFCPASGTYFTFIDTGQFVSWSLAKRAADHHVIPTAQRPKQRSHLATIKSIGEQNCIRTVAEIARDTLHEVAVGWIGATDAEWIPHYYDVLSRHHGDPATGGASDSVPWTRYTVGTGETMELTQEHLFDCGSLGKIVGGFDSVAYDSSDSSTPLPQYWYEKTYGGSLEEELPYHTAVHIELDFVKLDTWDGERAYMWVHEPENPDVENPVWEQSFRGGGRNLCGRSSGDGTVHVTTTIMRRDCSGPSRPAWCSRLSLKFNTTLDQSTNDESYGIQNIIISFRDENHQWRWGGDDNSPLTRAGSSAWSPAASDAPALGDVANDNSPWHPGQPSGPTEHYVAVEWPHWESGAWHDCESETQVIPPTWPRCFYGLHSEPRQDIGVRGPAIRDDVAMISFATTQWPTDNNWGMTMVLDLIDDDPAALIPPGDGHLNIMHVGDERGETSPAVWIVPSDTERRLHIRTSTTSDAEWGCTTEDLNGEVSTRDPTWTKPQLGRSSTDEKQHIHLTVTVQTVRGESRLFVYIDGYIASAECDGQNPAPGRIRDYDAPLFLGGDPYFGGFKGETQSICLHPNHLDETTVRTLAAQEVTAAEKGVHVDAAGSNLQQIEDLTDGRVLTNLAIPFRWDDEDRVWGHGTDSVDFPGSVLHFPGGGEHSDGGQQSEFAVEMTLRVRHGPNGQFRNVFHLGNDEEGFAHVCLLDRTSMKMIVGVAHQGETDPRQLAAGCTSHEEIFLDEDVLIVYSFVGAPGSLAGTLYINGEESTGCSFASDSTDTATMRGKMFQEAADGSIAAEMLHLILGDTLMSRHSIDLEKPGFYGDISRIVLHEQALGENDVFELYEPHCGKHLHGYYVESTIPPLDDTTGGGGAIYDADACDGECVTAKYLTILMMGMACPCCLFFAFFFYEKTPMLDVAPEMMPTMGGDNPAPQTAARDTDAFEMDSFSTESTRKPPPDLAPEETGLESEPSAEATSPARTRPPSLAQVGRNVRNAQRLTRSATPERSDNSDT